MKLHVINTGFFKLDGGAMFGVVPKSLWQRQNPADENNLCTWALRCLLIEDSDRKILIDTGIGSKQDESFFKHFYLHGEDSLENSIKQLGLELEDITDVILTHMHFDHVGGAVVKDKDTLVPTFPNAVYWTSKKHLENALNPNVREKASFLKENIVPLLDNDCFQFIDECECSPFEHISFEWVDGHTIGQMLPIIEYGNHTIAFCADLFPSVAHIPLPYVMAYDMQPLLTLKEKDGFLQKALDNNYHLFFEHDPKAECCNLQKTEKGIRVKDQYPLSSIL